MDLKEVLQSSFDSLNARIVTSGHRRTMESAVKQSTLDCNNYNQLKIKFDAFVDASVFKNKKSLIHIHTVVKATTKEYHELMDVARDLTIKVETLQKDGTGGQMLTQKIMASEKAIQGLKSGKQFLVGLDVRAKELQKEINHVMHMAGREEDKEIKDEEKEEEQVAASSEQWETLDLTALKDSLTSSISQSDSKNKEVEELVLQQKKIKSLEN